MVLEIFIPGIPTPKQSVRFDFKNKRTYQPAKVEQKAHSMAWIIKEQLPYDFTPFTGPVKILLLHYIFPPLKSFSKKKLKAIQEGETIYKTTKPDITDNLAKMLFDCMEGFVYLNDSQVCSMDRVSKYYGMIPGIKLVIQGE